jgi:hypothetical protein
MPPVPLITRPEHSNEHNKLVTGEAASLLRPVLLGAMVLALAPVVTVLVCVLVVGMLDDRVVVDVSTRGSNFSGWTEIAPALKCFLSVPSTASVELTSSPRKVAL